MSNGWMPRRFSETGDDVASALVAALLHRSIMCVGFESSYRCRTRSPDIAHRWKSYSRFALLRSPHTTGNPEHAQFQEARRRAL